MQPPSHARSSPSRHQVMLRHTFVDMESVSIALKRSADKHRVYPSRATSERRLHVPASPDRSAVGAIGSASAQAGEEPVGFSAVDLASPAG